MSHPLPRDLSSFDGRRARGSFDFAVTNPPGPLKVQRAELLPDGVTSKISGRCSHPHPALREKVRFTASAHPQIERSHDLAHRIHRRGIRHLSPSFPHPAEPLRDHERCHPAVPATATAAAAAAGAAGAAAAPRAVLGSSISSTLTITASDLLGRASTRPTPRPDRPDNDDTCWRMTRVCSAMSWTGSLRGIDGGCRGWCSSM